MKHLLFVLILFFPLLAFSQQEKKEVTLSETFGQCISAGGRIPTKKSDCDFNTETTTEEYAINDSIVYCLKIAVVSKDKPNTWKGFPEGVLFLEPNEKLFYRYNKDRIIACDLDTAYFIVVFPWNTSLQKVTDDKKSYLKSKGCSSEIIQGTKASFEVAVRRRSVKKN